ncbi:alpha-galactosidase [Nonomuraea jabiensis]|uniref:alpha-galactosidase n=1 Tax=Nonomuraea jabiensis TaxID=882448 RepID=UPI003D747867
MIDALLDSGLPLVEVTATGHGRHWSSHRLIDTAIGSRMRRRRRHSTGVELHDPQTGLVAEIRYRSPEGLPVLRSEVLLRNEGEHPLILESVTSLVVGGFPADGAELMWAENDWLAEYRWRRSPLRLTSPELSDQVRYGNGKDCFTLAGQGTWSSCGHLPMGGLTHRESGRTWLWQIEHNGGGWRWECGAREGTAYVALSGPSDGHHGWRHPLNPGEEFRTVPVALAVGEHDEAFAALTRYRRAIRRPHPDHERLPVIFNDYMNCLMGDPTTEKLLPLIDAAAEAGAEYFVIDAGWYAEIDRSWWDTVGAWEPSATRFPGGRISRRLATGRRGEHPGAPRGADLSRRQRGRPDRKHADPAHRALTGATPPHRGTIEMNPVIPVFHSRDLLRWGRRSRRAVVRPDPPAGSPGHRPRPGLGRGRHLLVHPSPSGPFERARPTRS